jgi:hypothetical protein
MKTFYVQTLGTAKYYVSFHNGVSRHNDGSDFFDMKIFKNKKSLNKFLTELRNDGYINKDWVDLQ